MSKVLDSLLDVIKPHKMWNRFVEFCWHPSVMQDRMPQHKFKHFRYPAPGSQAQEVNKFNYKVGYKDSIHTVRYTQSNIFYRNNGVKNTYGRSLIDTHPIFDENKLLCRKDMGNIYNRESIIEVVRYQFEETKDRNSYENCVFDLNETYNYDFLLPQSYDMCANDPILRQMRLDLDFYMDKFNSVRAKAKKQTIMKGDPSLWQILDNSFQPETIKSLQSSIRDYSSSTDIEILRKSHNAVDAHKKSYIQFPIQSKYVE